MGSIIGLGDGQRLQGLELVGVEVRDAVGAEAVQSAWSALPDDLSMLFLTKAAHDALQERLDTRKRLVWVVLPQ